MHSDGKIYSITTAAATVTHYSWANLWLWIFHSKFLLRFSHSITGLPPNHHHAQKVYCSHCWAESGSCMQITMMMMGFTMLSSWWCKSGNIFAIIPTINAFTRFLPLSFLNSLFLSHLASFRIPTGKKKLFFIKEDQKRWILSEWEIFTPLCHCCCLYREESTSQL